MILLAVETTAATGSLAVAKIQNSKSQLLAVRRWQKKATHSEVITLECAAALKSSGLTLPDITHLACDVGPGSFTGIRVGLNLARTLAYALGIRARLVQSLEIHAFENLAIGDAAVIAIPAVQEFYYGGAYRRTSLGIETLSPAESLDKGELEHLSQRTKVGEIFFPKTEPKAEALVQIVTLNSKDADFLPWDSMNPLYIRMSEAEEKLRKGLLKPTV